MGSGLGGLVGSSCGYLRPVRESESSLIERMGYERQKGRKVSYGVSVWIWPIKISRVFTNWY